MVFEYFSWARAKKNTQELEKTNPQNPVLNKEDEDFLHKVTTKDAPEAPLPPTIIADNGEEKAVTSEKQIDEAHAASAVALPESQAAEDSQTRIVESTQSADVKDSAKDEKEDVTKEEPKEEPKEEMNDISKEEKNEETSNEDQAVEKDVAENGKADVTAEQSSEPVAEEQKGEAKKPAKESTEQEGKDETKKEDEAAPTPEKSKRTWASYVPSVPSVPRWGKGAAKTSEQAESTTGQNGDGQDAGTESAQVEEKKDTEKVDEKIEDSSKSNDVPGVKITEDINLDEKKTQDEKEVSVLLDRMNLSSINNRVFSFSQKSQDLFADFTVVLKDMINGVPTAYDDMDKLLKNNEGQLGEMFNNMPPFVKTLVKSLPAKLGSSLGPEMMAAASDKPGADLRTRMEAASKTQATASKKQKRKVPDMKSLASERGAVASMLSKIVNFLKLRFPAAVTGTNIIMSLAVFILMFVFWYSHKRGKEVRLAKAAETGEEGSEGEELETDEEESSETEKEEQPGSGEVVAEPQEGEQAKEEDSSTSAFVPSDETNSKGLEKAIEGGLDVNPREPTDDERPEEVEEATNLQST